METIETFLFKALNALEESAPQLADELQEITDVLSSPPRIAVVGRVKAGKSTLTNALIGAPVAETAALEATNVVTVYHYGAPDRAVATLRDGNKREVVIRHGQHAQLPCNPEDISYVDRWMSIRSLEEFSIIDTPGLSTLTTEHELATKRALSKRTNVVNADGAIFLFDSAPREDEVEFIKTLGFTQLNTFGVLAQADTFGEGALGEEDPLERAKHQAARMSQELSQYLSRVFPVSGLMAQTASTRALTETGIRRIKQYSDYSNDELLQVLLGERNIPEDLRFAVEHIAEYGLFRGRHYLTEGAVMMNAWLESRSGIDQLREAISSSMQQYALLHRSIRTVHRLENLAVRYPEYQYDIRNTLAQLVSDETMLPVRLFDALKKLQVDSRQKWLIQLVAQMLAENTVAGKLGLPSTAQRVEIIAEIGEYRRRLHSLKLSCTPAEEVAVPVVLAALDVIERPITSWV